MVGLVGAQMLIRMRDGMQTHRIARRFLVYGKVGWGSMIWPPVLDEVER